MTLPLIVVTDESTDSEEKLDHGQQSNKYTSARAGPWHERETRVQFKKHDQAPTDIYTVVATAAGPSVAVGGPRRETHAAERSLRGFIQHTLTHKEAIREAETQFGVGPLFFVPAANGVVTSKGLRPGGFAPN